MVDELKGFRFCGILQDLIMVSHAVWKTWPEGLSKQKPRPKAEVFVVTEAEGHAFYTAWETMIKSYYSTLDDWLFQCFIQIDIHFGALKKAIFYSLHGC